MDRYEKALEQARNYYPDNLFLELNNPDEPIYRDIITLRNDLKKLM